MTHRLSIATLIAVAAAATVLWGATGQEVTTRRAPVVRSIKVKPHPACPGNPLPAVSRQLFDRLKEDPIGLGVERPFEQHALDAAVTEIQHFYEERGRRVTVEFETRPIPPRSLEVLFRVIEQCACSADEKAKANR